MQKSPCINTRAFLCGFDETNYQAFPIAQQRVQHIADFLSSTATTFLLGATLRLGTTLGLRLGITTAALQMTELFSDLATTLRFSLALGFGFALGLGLRLGITTATMQVTQFLLSLATTLGFGFALGLGLRLGITLGFAITTMTNIQQSNRVGVGRRRQN